MSNKGLARITRGQLLVLLGVVLIIGMLVASAIFQRGRIATSALCQSNLGQLHKS